MRWILAFVAVLTAGLFLCPDARAGDCRDVIQFRQGFSGGYAVQQFQQVPVQTYQVPVQQFQQVQTYQVPVQQFRQPVYRQPAIVEQPVFIQQRQSFGGAVVNVLGQIALEKQRQQFIRDSRRGRRGFRRR